MNNNPFQPTNPLPPVMSQGDANADNFTAQPVTFENFAPTGAPMTVAPIQDIPENPVDTIPVDAGMPNIETSPPPPSVSQFDNLMNQASSAPAPAPQPVKTRHFSISILTLLFFILTLAGGGGTVYFFQQNNDTLDKLGKAEAKIRELEGKQKDNDYSVDKDSSQYDTLQSKIATLTKKDDENTKTIEDQKKQIEELTKKNETLTTEKVELQKKAEDISKLTDKLENVLKNCKVVTSGPAKVCSISIE
ncbi:hypothetical protein FWF74_03975 [Candidatus Saccharibacteria bacterium]|nr:hypothetical protein [Candidatus Saccharibacteria bacterium]MCL1962786.1 hypothetical protein [Candidatus Saccharibacteria bacterium]